MGDRMGNAVAHVTGAGTALRALSAGPEDVGWTPGPGPNGRIDLAFANGFADADIHALKAVSSRVATYSQAQNTGRCPGRSSPSRPSADVCRPTGDCSLKRDLKRCDPERSDGRYGAFGAAGIAAGL